MFPEPRALKLEVQFNCQAEFAPLTLYVLNIFENLSGLSIFAL